MVASTLSNESRKPPRPGMLVPESFMFATRFNVDSKRSPMTPANAQSNPNSTNDQRGKEYTVLSGVM